MREGTPPPAPCACCSASYYTAWYIPLTRVNPPSFALKRSVEPRGRYSYSTATKLRVIEYTRLRCPDGGGTGNRGTAAGLGQGLCPNWIREYYGFKPRRIFVIEKGVGGGKGRNKCLAHDARQADLVDYYEYIIDCRRQSLGVTRGVVMRKLISLWPNVFEGTPSNHPGAMERFRNNFANWYQRFRRRNKLSIRRKTSVGQKNPSRWGRDGAGDDPEGSRRAHRDREESHHRQEGRGGVRICGG